MRRAWLLIAVCFALACGHGPSAPPRNLTELVLRDSTYYAPETMEPYTGPVFGRFVLHPDRVQLEGELLNGAWNGELRVYHRSGRIRYEGRFENGVRCGAWTENADPRPTTSIYDELNDAIESLAVYPPCSDER
jgi:hypothetical protein